MTLARRGHTRIDALYCSFHASWEQGSTVGMPRADARMGFEAIDARLLDLAVPTDEWDILYRLRLVGAMAATSPT